MRSWCPGSAVPVSARGMGPALRSSSRRGGRRLCTICDIRCLRERPRCEFRFCPVRNIETGPEEGEVEPGSSVRTYPPLRVRHGAYCPFQIARQPAEWFHSPMNRNRQCVRREVTVCPYVFSIIVDTVKSSVVYKTVHQHGLGGLEACCTCKGAGGKIAASCLAARPTRHEKSSPASQRGSY